MGKKSFKERFIDFLDTKGFYIIVAVCLLIIGVSIYTIVSTDFAKYEVEENNQNVQSNETAKIPDIDTKEVTLQDKSKTAKNALEDKIQNKSTTTKINESIQEPNTVANTKSEVLPTNPSNNQTIKKSTKSKSYTKNITQDKLGSTLKSDEEIEVINPLVFKPIYPISGKVIRNYSDDSLEYSKTLDEWTEHPGIDIQAEAGADVKACFDGTVIDLGTDPLYGNYVAIDHGDGYISKYYNLQDLKYVQLGEIVRQGQKIGEIGNSANIEYMDPPHLHFELIYNSDNQNPLKFLPQK